MSKNDTQGVKDDLAAAKNRIVELLPNISSDELKATAEKVLADVSELQRKLESNEATLDDVSAFLRNAREKLKQRLLSKLHGKHE